MLQLRTFRPFLQPLAQISICVMDAVQVSFDHVLYETLSPILILLIYIIYKVLKNKKPGAKIANLKLPASVMLID